MRFYLILFFCIAFFFSSCGEGEKPLPPGILAEHDLSELLTDIQLVDGRMYLVPQMPDSLNKHGLGLYMAVFKLHHTDSATFKRTLRFYAANRTNLLYDISTVINQRLKKKLDSLKLIKPKINLDSLRKANIKRNADSLMKLKAKVDSIKKATSVHKQGKSQKNKKQHALSR